MLVFPTSCERGLLAEDGKTQGRATAAFSASSVVRALIMQAITPLGGQSARKKCGALFSEVLHSAQATMVWLTKCGGIELSPSGRAEVPGSESFLVCLSYNRGRALAENGAGGF